MMRPTKRVTPTELGVIGGVIAVVLVAIGLTKISLGFLTLRAHPEDGVSAMTYGGGALVLGLLLSLGVWWAKRWMG